LQKGVRELRDRRDADGGWQGFPFWYTVLALSEIDLKEASAELKHASPALERAVRRVPAPSDHSRRRHELARRVLEAS
jgi:hypothetical protein